jgi:hypothetical protein
MDWLEDVAGPNFAPAALWTLLALVVLVIVLVVARIVRSMTFGTFVAGGRNRKTRLAVMDAAAVDSQRRLVLVRRDDVEHLILIGGPTDVVVERDIRLHAPARRPAPPAEQFAEAQPRQRPAGAPAPARPAQRPAEPQPTEPSLQNLMPQSPRPAAAPPARPAAVRMPATAPATETGASAARPVAPAPPAAAPVAPRLKPLDPPRAADIDPGSARKTQRMPELSLEDEMNRLLGELSKK